MPQISKTNRITQKLKALKTSKPVLFSEDMLWKGPENNNHIDGGITQSMIANYLCDPERFRLKTIFGLEASDSYKAYLEYGNMWHICEEHPDDWETQLYDYTVKAVAEHQEHHEEIEKWYRVCHAQFPVYVDFWKKHKQTYSHQTILAEEEFDIPYLLPSGRTVYLRGKFDEILAIDISGANKKKWNPKTFLKENKTKGEVDESLLVKQLRFDLQTMFYLVALRNFTKTDKYKNLLKNALGNYKESASEIGGVLYNVVRRPLSGGKGSIRPHKEKSTKKTYKAAESVEEFYERLRKVIITESSTFFYRWEVEINADDICKFEKTCLIPILETICDQYDWWYYCFYKNLDVFDTEAYKEYAFENTPKNTHFRMPYGIYNPLMDGRATQLDNFVDNNTIVGISRKTRMFSELSKERVGKSNANSKKTISKS